MTLHSDHVAGAAFIVFGAAIIALSGDLPFGTLAFPGSGFLPRIVAVAMMLLGLTLVLRGAESPPLAAIDWDGRAHALLVVLATAIAIAAYEVAGFVVTVGLLIFALLVVVERRNPVRAAAYSLVVTALTYSFFSYALKTQLPTGPFGF